MNDVNSFKKGDEVAFRLDEDEISLSTKDSRWIVIEIKEKTLLISNKGEKKEVDPCELLTSDEIKNVEKKLETMRGAG